MIATIDSLISADGASEEQPNPVQFMNDETYQRLKAVLQLRLRRQVLIAVCDNLQLRSQLLQACHQDLSTSAKLVDLQLEMTDPDPLAQVSEWLRNNPGYPQPVFQVLGIERLTLAPALAQKLFLSNLERIESALRHLDSTLVFWFTQPWASAACQSAPLFWSWRSGVFEFEGDPTPIANQGSVAVPDIRLPENAPSLAERETVTTELLTTVFGMANGSAESPPPDLTPATRPLSPRPLEAASAAPAEAPEDLAEAMANEAIAEATLEPANDLDNQRANEVISESVGELTSGPVGEFETVSSLEEPDSLQVQSEEVDYLSPEDLQEYESIQAEMVSAALEQVALGLEAPSLAELEAAINQSLAAYQEPTEVNLTDADLPEDLDGLGSLFDAVLVEPTLPPVEAPAAGPPAQTQSPTQSQPQSLAAQAEPEQETPQDLGLGSLFSDALIDQGQGEDTGSLFSEALINELIAAEALPETPVELPIDLPIELPVETPPEIPREIPTETPAAPVDLLDETETTQLIEPTEVQEQRGEIAELEETQASPALLALEYRRLGDSFRELSEQQGGLNPSHLLQAAQAYQQALDHLDRTQTPAEYAEIQNDLGNVFWLIAQHSTDPAACLHSSIAAYEAALQVADSARYPQAYAMVQNNLGTAYSDLARYKEPAANLQRAVLAYQAALLYRTPDSEPLKYAATQNNLGTAYWNLAQYVEPTKHLQRAIQAYLSALEYYTPETDALSYAMIQNNLGTAYWQISQQKGIEAADAPASLLQAIGAYEAALVYRTSERHPSGYAATQNNLGTAYWHLSKHLDPEQNLQRAIMAYEAALHYTEVRQPPVSASFDLGATHNNLGLAYRHLPTGNRRRNLDRALRHHGHAAQGWKSQPQAYQSAVGNLVQDIRTAFTEFGIEGQAKALSSVPAELLSDVMKRL
ncbi:tetratricopeptide repeat protein [Leptolyngbya sp. FACHB-261]|uniref:tetratricopeptide repeat protein n=1 Tax=Leptolyngbya sp. FACHB-261 TaxID=2692806 RepID=UPI001687D79E|nr:tetratricopeptide repeat protein [Leptolyngbya sp. FACHB-261]MBD2102193.1 tetratricopeptide repeat protein [Leptolyngbya sp. FACHB-261]